MAHPHDLGPRNLWMSLGERLTRIPSVLPTACLAMSSMCPTYRRSRDGIQGFSVVQDPLPNTRIEECGRDHINPAAMEEFGELTFDAHEVQPGT